MGATESLDQLAGILQRNEIAFERLELDLIRVTCDSVVVFASARLESNGNTIIGVWSSVLVDLVLDAERQAAALSAVNDLNQRSTVPRFVLYDDEAAASEIRAEYELLADDLQAAEAIYALLAIGRASNDNSQELRELLGSGCTYIESRAIREDVIDT